MAIPKMDIKSLGIVQIMIGLVILMFGVAIKDIPVKTVNSGIAYWGSLCLIICGSLSITVMEKRLPILIKASLGMNAVSAVAAVGAMIVFSVDLQSFTEDNCLQKGLCEAGTKLITLTEHLLVGILRVLLIFFILEICTSIWTFILIWKSRHSTS